jgi:general secretion pathway protein K
VRRAQSGLAVVVAMLAIAIATTTAIALVDAQLLRARAYENAAARAQADAIGRAAAQWAAAVLDEDERAVDHLGEPWAHRLPPLPAERATLQGTLADEQARFNLNNLVRDGVASPRDVLIFQRLLQALALPPALADALVDWMDADAEPGGTAGAEDAFYQALDPPYRPANRRLAELGELARVRGFGPATVAALAPYVTALPAESRVNVNTAPAAVLRAVVPSLGAEEAQRILETRAARPYRTREDFLRDLAEPPAAAVDSDLDVRSRWFSAAATIRLDRTVVRYRALLDRPERGGFPMVVAVVPEAF